MRFISNGDYIFPFQFKAYWAEHMYMWSFQHGAANPDGIMRLPGRFLDLLVFALFGNIGIGYFYVISCLAVAFLAFWWFARVFLKVHQLSLQLCGALFFTLNPIFLGNLSKVGLILAAAMLPAALTALSQGFKERRFSYFLLYVAAMNISLLHPFTFSVNLVVSGIFLIYIARRHATFVRDNIIKFGAVLITALLLNAYLILPLVALGTIDKGALSDSATSAPADYTSLVDIANTGDIFTGLSLSKGVLKDYEFYGARTWPFYFLGVFAFYVILFSVYIKVERRAKPDERRRFVLSLAIFLVLLALSTASFLHADALIKFLIGLPGGWMFRSPLKWQLYMPLPLITALVIALKYVQSKRHIRLLYAALGCTFVFMNAYLCTQIYNRLLKPRQLSYFGALTSIDLSHKTMLFVNSTTCMAYARDNPTIATELNQIFISNDVQVKHVEAGSIDTVNAGQYDYVLGCRETLDVAVLTSRYAFSPAATFAGQTYALYRNTRPVPYVRTIPTMYAATQPAAGLSGKYAFTQSLHPDPFTFIPADTTHPATGLQDVFDSLSPASIAGDTLSTQLTPISAGEQRVYLRHTQPLFYNVDGRTITLSPIPAKGDKPVPAELTIRTETGQTLHFKYHDPAFTYSNAVPDGSFEEGPWQKTVGDCNNYDNEPDIAMRINEEQHTTGKHSLQLEAKQHIACTGPKEIAVSPGEHYLLHFDYASRGGRYAGYNVSFDDTSDSSSGRRMDSRSGRWDSYTTELIVPEGATHMRLLLYAFPDSAPGKRGNALYDNVSVTRIPDIKNHFFVQGPSPQVIGGKSQVDFTVVNPTKTTMRVQSDGKPFYLVTNETFNRLWRLQTDTGAHGLNGVLQAPIPLAGAEHVRINDSTNGWFIDPAIICTRAPTACTRTADGSYDLRLAMSFTPQRWFYMGSIVSGITAAGVVGYAAYDIRRHRREARK